ncbi:hypothetical protein HBI81_165810 [Parastagonospora nodorum]|nr:hypothetical protein HBH43_225070 [Parastagonospora nodorum]KAH4286181.1 hypothetical protein HBI01_240760 [Parastagonospora nodorum]KAH5002777.1 hypothetical protein HBI74_239880 [Parastagonospora nodorum]KAH5667021.1 hypothetical protein HBI21_225100 [Parastagonospora nodorum]KAH5789067.1 hypothetical protein HBI96_220240 [Parastagonospora nodorum]
MSVMSQWTELTLMGVAIALCGAGQSAPTIRSTQVSEEVDVKRSESELWNWMSLRANVHRISIALSYFGID